ncbi:hypothetical protein EV359DRAFT_83062 [Lentinula novae-zelandiae]|nr:hypothetical protein EV359DRAFT_83062 [Lentinula novae-zelandiae]
MSHFNYLLNSICTPLFKERKKPNGIYDRLAHAFAGMGANTIANAELNQDFFWFNFAEAQSSNYSFHGVNSKTYTGNIFGEIVGQANDTFAGAQGNHYIGPDPSNLKQLNDYTKTKCTIVIACPSFATPAVSDLFYNQICTFSSIRDADQAEEFGSDIEIVPKEIVKSLKNTGELDAITLTGPSLYTVINTAQQVFVGTEYDHHLMPDFGGPVFAFRKVKLIQPQWSNINNELIVPWKNYEYLRPGTLIAKGMSDASICINLLTPEKIYHPTITSLKVVAESDLHVTSPIPFAPTKKILGVIREPSSQASEMLAAIDWSTPMTPPSASGSDRMLEDDEKHLPNQGPKAKKVKKQ